MLPAAEAEGSIELQWVDCNHCAVPDRVDVCVPARSATEMVAVFAPVVCAVSGLNCTVTTQVAPGARVVSPSSCPPPPAPPAGTSLTTDNSVALFPPSAPCPRPAPATSPT